MSAIIDQLDLLYQHHGDDIEAWFAKQRRQSPPLLYTSVDLRHGGFKIAPVDTNLFPAGFNNLSPAASRRAVTHLGGHLRDQNPDWKKILIVPENHTRNLYYFENLFVLQSLLEASGFEVRIGSLIVEPGMPISQMTAANNSITLYPMKRSGNVLETDDGFRPDVIVMNNDMSAGVPEILNDVQQPIMPPLYLGWWRRRKSVHFIAYNGLVADFGKTFSIDPWLLSTTFRQCGRVNFHEQTGIDCVAYNVEKALEEIQQKYHEHGITDKPFVFVKADSGTYGMGIMTVHSGEEMLEMNKKLRNKMNTIKEGQQNTEVIIQEGVPTIDEVKGKTAEPMIYLADGIPVGGAYRVNSERDAFSNLNAQGMEFAGMCDESEITSDRVKITNCNFRVFGLIGAIAALAAAREPYSEYSI